MNQKLKNIKYQLTCTQHHYYTNLLKTATKLLVQDLGYSASPYPSLQTSLPLPQSPCTKSPNGRVSLVSPILRITLPSAQKREHMHNIHPSSCNVPSRLPPTAKDVFWKMGQLVVFFRPYGTVSALSPY